MTLTELKQNAERATKLDSEIKALQNFPPNPIDVDARNANGGHYLEDPLLRMVIKRGITTLLSEKQKELESILNPTPPEPDFSSVEHSLMSAPMPTTVHAQMKVSPDYQPREMVVGRG